MDPTTHQKQPEEQERHYLGGLQGLRSASKELQNFTLFLTKDPQASITAVLNQGDEIKELLETDPSLFKLSHLLCNLQTALGELGATRGYGLPSIIRRQAIYYKISQLARQIEREAQGYLDKDSIFRLLRTLDRSEDEGAKVKVLTELEVRLWQGFDRDYQDLILKAKVFQLLESILCDNACSRTIREHAAQVIVALIRFNRNVFVGLVLMGPTLEALISMGSCRSIQVLTSLVALVRSPLIDEIESLGEVPRIMALLRSQDPATRVAAIDCLCEIAYHGRKEVIEAMLEQGLIETLLELQRQDQIHRDGEHDEDRRRQRGEEEEEEEEGKRGGFDGCVAKFAVQVEVGEGLTNQERREFKMEILRRVKRACVSEAEDASVSAEVLWGSSA
ncbi:hypothetical protein BT93_C1734 [Corymbia citriodora subsp. variegata]|nr:hypothetical protein BT93_C1734 [Corymbia citriodora subsp. variegata]